MRSRFVALAALALLNPALTLAADEPRNTGPTLTVRLKSLDGLTADVLYLAKLVGQEEAAKAVENQLKAAIGEKGIEGLDPKKSIGLYGKLNANLVESEVVLLVPVSDEKKLLDMLGKVGIKPDKQDNGVYKFMPEGSPFPVLFRFANGYAYATLREDAALAKDKLLTPDKVFPAGDDSTMSVTVDLGAIPVDLKKFAVGLLDGRIADLKDQKLPGETPAQAKFRGETLDYLAKGTADLIKEGGEVTLKLGVDQKAGDLALSLSVAGQPETSLAKAIAGLGKVPSLGAGLIGGDSAFHVAAYALLPESLRKAIDPVIDESVKQALAQEKDKAKRDLMDVAFKAVLPTVKSGEVDGAFDLRGPTAGGKYVAVFGVKVKDGAGIEKAVKELVKALPREDQGKLQVDADKAGDVNVHKIDMKGNTDARSKEILGEGPAYFAVRDDLLVLVVGDKALETIKEVLSAKPKVGKAIDVELSMARMAKLMQVSGNVKGIEDAAKKVFAKEKDGDKVRLTVEGGKALTITIGMKAPVLTFASQVRP